MRRIFFSKGSKFDVDYRNPEKNPGNKLGFGDNIITIGFVKHLLLPKRILVKYLSFQVNMLTKSIKILYTARTEYFEVKVFQSDQKICQSYLLCRIDQCFRSFNMLTLCKF